MTIKTGESITWQYKYCNAGRCSTSFPGFRIRNTKPFYMSPAIAGGTFLNSTMIRFTFSNSYTCELTTFSIYGEVVWPGLSAPVVEIFSAALVGLCLNKIQTSKAVPATRPTACNNWRLMSERPDELMPSCSICLSVCMSCLSVRKQIHSRKSFLCEFRFRLILVGKNKLQYRSPCCV